MIEQAKLGRLVNDEWLVEIPLRNLIPIALRTKAIDEIKTQ